MEILLILLAIAGCVLAYKYHTDNSKVKLILNYRQFNVYLYHEECYMVLSPTSDIAEKALELSGMIEKEPFSGIESVKYHIDKIWSNYGF